MKVFNSAQLPDVFSTCSGDPVVPEYRDIVSETGSLGVEIVGSYNRDDMIQEALPQVLVYNILEKAQTDPSVLARFKAEFVDITNSPKSLMELQQTTLDTYAKFNALPLEFRRLFDNNVHSFIEHLHNGSADDIIKGFIRSHSKEFNVSLESVVDSNNISNKSDKGDVE